MSEVPTDTRLPDNGTGFLGVYMVDRAYRELASSLGFEGARGLLPIGFGVFTQDNGSDSIRMTCMGTEHDLLTNITTPGLAHGILHVWMTGHKAMADFCMNAAATLPKATQADN